LLIYIGDKTDVCCIVLRSLTSNPGDGSNFCKTARAFVEAGFPFLLFDLAGVAERDSASNQLGLFTG
jgi:hypothetical protein